MFCSLLIREAQHCYHIVSYCSLNGASLCVPECPFNALQHCCLLFVSRSTTLLPADQHALAMVGGVITVPLLIAGAFNANLWVTNQTTIQTMSRRCTIWSSLSSAGTVSHQSTRMFLPTMLLGGICSWYVFVWNFSSSLTVFRVFSLLFPFASCFWRVTPSHNINELNRVIPYNVLCPRDEHYLMDWSFMTHCCSSII